MSQSVICSGCGARLAVSEDYTRKKMRCTQCGVIFDLPEPEHRSSIPAPPPPRTERPTAPARTPPAKTAPSRKSAPKPVHAEKEIALAPSTSVKDSSSAPTPSAPSAESLPDDSEDDEFAFSDGKDTRAYEKTGQEIRECPHCHATVNPDAKVCSACGFMLTELKTDATGQSLQRRWESGWSFRGRLIGFCVCQVLSVLSVAGGIFAGLSIFTIVFPYILYTGMTAFLFGSYNWTELSRNKKGKLRLTQTWRICFIERPPTTLKMREYEELATGVEHQFDTMDWVMLLFLSLFGIIPGLWWWFYVGSKDTYFVALCRDHGYPVVTLYRGWDQDKMEDMAETISKVARLPLRR